MASNGSSAFEVTLSFLLGTATGFILGVLFAPASGEETRKKIKEEAQSDVTALPKPLQNQTKTERLVVEEFPLQFRKWFAYGLRRFFSRRIVAFPVVFAFVMMAFYFDILYTISAFAVFLVVLIILGFHKDRKNRVKEVYVEFKN